MKKFWVTSCVAVIGAFSATSATPDTYKDCAVAIENEDIDQIERLAVQIESFDFIPAHKREAAEACISAAKGVSLVYNPEARAFISHSEAEAVRQRYCELRDVIYKTSSILEAAEAARQERRIEALAVTNEECSAWFEVDARAALTNEVCNSIFVNGGIPNSNVKGPSQVETLMAKLNNDNARAEVEIIAETGLSLEAFMATLGRAEEKAEDLDDLYNCE